MASNRNFAAQLVAGVFARNARLGGNNMVQRYKDKNGQLRTGLGPDWQGDCYCNGMWGKECCTKLGLK